MSQIHVVNQGECLASIAGKYGFHRWQTIYEHHENAEFRQKRPNPNLLYPGDRLIIPDKEMRYESGETGKRHTFRRKDPTVLLRIVVRDERGEVMGAEPYVLRVGKVEHKGETSGEGLLEKEIRVGERQGELRLEGRDTTLTLMLSHLDPIDDNDSTSRIVTGAQARLNNLGYFCGRVDDHAGPMTSAAIRDFQERVMGRAEPDGELDKETRDALTREHGS